MERRELGREVSIPTYIIAGWKAVNEQQYLPRQATTFNDRKRE